MKKRALVSIIIPVYNVEKYLDACVESAIGQSYEHIEVILVNDKSTDRSAAMCDVWAKKDKRVRVIHKQNNEGVNMARHTGFNSSKGDYVMFLDSDDILHREGTERSLVALIDNDADIVVYGHNEFSDANEKTNLLKKLSQQDEINVLKTSDEVARYAFFGDGNFPDVFRMTVWGKLYKRKIISKVDWSVSNYRYYEDNFWIAPVLLSAKRLVILSDKLVNYRRNTKYNHIGPSLSGQLTGNLKDGRPIGYLEQVKHLFDLDIKLAKKYGVINLKDRLEDKYYGEMLWRIDGLSRAGLLNAENNLEHFPEVWAWYRERSARERAEIVYLAKENIRLSTELDSHLRIKRSARLLIGNIKRRISGAK